MSHAPVVIKEYNFDWPLKFEKERIDLLAIAGDWCVGGIKHIGSTAIPGMLVREPLIKSQ